MGRTLVGPGRQAAPAVAENRHHVTEPGGLYTGSGSTPIPDPTRLTTEAVASVAEQFRRELAAAIARIEARLTAMDEAAALRLDLLREVRPQTERLISHQRDLDDVKFAAIGQRFDERDVRAEQAATAGKQALDAALQAAKELVGQQNKAASDAAAVMVANFTKLIDQLGLRLESLQKSYDDRLTEIKERIDRGEGAARGATETRTEQRLTTGQQIALVALALTALAIIITVVLASHPAR
jgi:hypothetical protein